MPAYCHGGGVRDFSADLSEDSFDKYLKCEKIEMAGMEQGMGEMRG
jgi:hypothetical protein